MQRRLVHRIISSTIYPIWFCTAASSSSSYCGRLASAFVGGKSQGHSLLGLRRIACSPFSQYSPAGRTAHRRMVSNVVDASKLDLLNDDDDDEAGSRTDGNSLWRDLLPFQETSHNSATIVVPNELDENILFHPTTFQALLTNTVTALRDMDKSSIWIEVPLMRARLMEDMVDLGFRFHHAHGTKAKLNLWLREDIPSKVPEFATHHVGVGAVVINSRDEILCVRELRKNYMPWKVPTGLSELGESITDAAIREVLEETGVPTKFHSILSFRHTHGMANGRSDLFFVCRLVPIEDDGVIPTPKPQECEIAEALWLPLSEYRTMVDGTDSEPGHPMMSFVMKHVFDKGTRIEHLDVTSVVPGRKPTPMYFPQIPDETP
jgi:ADP-ribose pyrophosphatase YjhB (NUDIX family)